MDSRLAQIESETLQEQQAQQSLRAFSGFGRSTQLLSEIDVINAEAQKRKTQLEMVIGIEKMIAAGGGSDSLYRALGDAQTALNKMAKEAEKRRAQISQNLMGVGIQEERKRQIGLQFRNPFKTTKFKIKQKAQMMTSKIGKLARIQPFGKITPISKILSIGASKHFGTLKSLATY